MTTRLRSSASRSFASIGLLIASLSAAPCVFAATPQQHQYVFHHENVLGTSLELKIRATSPDAASRAESGVLAEIDRENRILSAWQPDSEFSRWAGTQGTAEHVSPELFQVLSLFDLWREKTGGALDASAEVAVRAWKKAAAENRAPNPTELQTAVVQMQQPHWRLDAEHQTATHLDRSPIALNSFAKSYIAGNAANAALANAPEVSGVLLNVGGDIVLRGSIASSIDIANPQADAENDVPMDRVTLSNRAIATSGGYRRGVDISGAHFSHIVDPRTALPVNHVLSSTVIAPDPSEAGALSTAFSVMTPGESQRLAAQLRNVDYMILLKDGTRITSRGWSALELPRLQTASYVPQAKSAAPAVAGAMDVTISLELARMDNPRYRRPFVAVWVEDKDRFPVRTLALWFDKTRWLPDLKTWYRDDRVRSMVEGSDVTTTVSSATRPPGKYTLRWDGKDQAGKPVKPGKYTISIEAAREHGTYQVVRQEIDFDGKTPSQFTMPGNTEIAAASVDYRKR
ncbi:MAG: ApbE family lipoprotein [Acidobacteriaceae bacterium]|nr:ApbE family lipoprotein [Acidobacteriaceae bacterium]